MLLQIRKSFWQKVTVEIFVFALLSENWTKFLKLEPRTKQSSKILIVILKIPFLDI